VLNPQPVKADGADDSRVTITREVGRDCCSEKIDMPLAASQSESSCRCGRQQPCWERLCLDQTHSSSVLSVSTGWRTSSGRRLGWTAQLKPDYTTADVVLSGRQYICVWSVNACKVRPCFSVLAAMSAKYEMNNSSLVERSARSKRRTTLRGCTSCVMCFMLHGSETLPVEKKRNDTATEKDESDWTDVWCEIER